jgi:hypothetical protein
MEHLQRRFMTKLFPTGTGAMYCDGKINSFTSIDDVKKEVNVIAETCSQDDVILHRVIEELDV